MRRDVIIFIIFVITLLLFLYLLIIFYEPNVGDRFRFIIDLMVRKQLWRESFR
ncbi:MAG: hypothetical protein N3C62_01940 [Synergistetes bacterium]|nr:hypothetical protein [Synergistota bacterium]MCX8127495.1 hypothetical protein [Synergistota bacterium]MDW8192728.1 hypothetical protein [Synergistota bacterium]